MSRTLAALAVVLLAAQPVPAGEPSPALQQLADLEAREGESFVGSTLARLCTRSHRGASYATSEVTLSAAGLVSWDRGFDAAGVQVWGAVEGGYAFDRLADPVPVPAPTVE